MIIECVPPAISCFFFAHSSAWILVLAALAYQEMRMFGILLGASSIASAMHWANFETNSWYAWFDKGLALSVFLYMCRGQDGLLFWGIFSLTVFCFLKGRRVFLLQQWSRHMIWHAAFRFCAFWTVCIFLQKTRPLFVVWWSLLYWSHFLASYCLFVKSNGK